MFAKYVIAARGDGDMLIKQTTIQRASSSIMVLASSLGSNDSNFLASILLLTLPWYFKPEVKIGTKVTEYKAKKVQC